MNIIRNISDAIFKIEKIFAILIGALMLFAIAAGVLFRYVLSAPLVWSDEVAILCLVWITFLGASMSVKKHNSPAITFLMDKLSGTPRKILLIIGMMITLIFIGTIIYISFGWLSSPNIAVQKTASLELPMIVGYISVPVCFICMFIHLLEITLSTIKDSGGVKS
jgi:TRAP-type C4-dicarboxylate transport system permease small subunit